MRIGLVPNLDRSFGGTYQYAVTMVRAFRDLGLDDEVAVFLYVGESLPPELSDIPFETVEMRTATGPAGSAWRLLSLP